MFGSAGVYEMPSKTVVLVIEDSSLRIISLHNASALVGAFVGARVGAFVGAVVGAREGASVVWNCVGVSVGAPVVAPDAGVGA